MPKEDPNGCCLVGSLRTLTIGIAILNMIYSFTYSILAFVELVRIFVIEGHTWHSSPVGVVVHFLAFLIKFLLSILLLNGAWTRNWRRVNNWFWFTSFGIVLAIFGDVSSRAWISVLTAAHYAFTFLSLGVVYLYKRKLGSEEQRARDVENSGGGGTGIKVFVAIDQANIRQ